MLGQGKRGGEGVRAPEWGYSRKDGVGVGVGDGVGDLWLWGG